MKKLENYLKTQFKEEENIKEYINAALEQYFEDHNKELFLASLKEVIQAKGGVSEFSKQTHINRQHIYKMLSTKGNPSFNNIGSLLTALGLKLQVENAGHSIH
jgi:probable addiction module antidote protein